jgi:squalene synthase HpnC
LADETGDPQQSLVLLDWWETQTRELPAGPQRHPVFVALAETVREFDLPQQPLLDLLTAFRQDQHKLRYATFDELLGYCRNSANPVGRLVLHLGRCHNAETAELSDSICTGLQLANFWQDVARDYDRGRIYLPQEDLTKFDYSEESWARQQATDEFRKLLRFEVERAETHLESGRPLIGLVSREIRLPVRLFLAGGQAILAAIRRQRYDVWSRRPTVSKWTKLCLFARAWSA